VLLLLKCQILVRFDSKITLLKKIQKKSKKSVDKRGVVWYNGQAVAENCGSKRSLKIEQQEISTKLKASVNYLVNYLRENTTQTKVKEQSKLGTKILTPSGDKIQ